MPSSFTFSLVRGILEGTSDPFPSCQSSSKSMMLMSTLTKKRNQIKTNKMSIPLNEGYEWPPSWGIPAKLSKIEKGKKFD